VFMGIAGTSPAMTVEIGARPQATQKTVCAGRGSWGPQRNGDRQAILKVASDDVDRDSHRHSQSSSRPKRSGEPGSESRVRRAGIGEPLGAPWRPDPGSAWGCPG